MMIRLQPCPCVVIPTDTAGKEKVLCVSLQTRELRAGCDAVSLSWPNLGDVGVGSCGVRRKCLSQCVRPLSKIG